MRALYFIAACALLTSASTVFSHENTGHHGDHGHAAAGTVRRLPRQARLQPFALAAVAGLLLDDEAVLGQAAPHGARDGEGGDLGAGGGAGGDQGHDLGRPHAGVEGGREAVEEPGVGGAGPLLQRPLGVADGEVDAGLPLRQVKAVDQLVKSFEPLRID